MQTPSPEPFIFFLTNPQNETVIPSLRQTLRPCTDVHRAKPKKRAGGDTLPILKCSKSSCHCALDWFQRSTHWQNNRSDQTNSPWEPALSPSQGSRTGNPIVHRASAFSFFYCPLPFPHTFLTFYLHLFKVQTAPDTKTSYPPQRSSGFKQEFQHSFNNRLCLEPQFLNEEKKTILAS